MKTKNLLIAAAVALSKQIKKMKNMRKQLPSPPPSGLFGVYAFPEKGQYVTGVNFQHHEFDGLLNGSSSVSATDTTSSAPNQFVGQVVNGMTNPSTLRVVPNSAKANVVMPFINYTLDDKIALVALVPLIEKESKMESFAGGSSSTSVGKFTINSKGLGTSC